MAKSTAKKRAGRDAVWVWGPSVLIAVVGVAVAAWFVEPAPPTRVTIATGAAGGAYEQAAQRYAAYFAGKGVELVTLPTAGSLDNVALLADAGAGVDAALVQGGLAAALPEGQLQRLRAVVAVFYEPLWLVARRGGPVASVRDIGKGVRVSLGLQGSGTRALAVELMAELGVGDLSATPGLPAAEAVAKLRSGELDLAALVVAPTAPIVAEILADPALVVLPLESTAALDRRHDALVAVTLPRGAVDPARTLPADDLTLLAPTASLVVSTDTHPAIVALLVEAAVATHRGGGLLHEPGTFPSPDLVDLPLHGDVRYHLTRGPNVLHRTLPFWLASMIDRLIILAIPLAALLIPLVRSAPPLYRWRIRSRIYKWYKQVHAVDERLIAGAPVDRLRADEKELDRIEQELVDTAVPLSYMEEFYHLRLHLDFIRRRLREKTT